MRFSHSLKENHIFRRLYAKGRSAASSLLVVYCRKNGTAENRVGLTVGKKLGHAVVRNRVRRRLREIYRLHEEEFLPGYDLVIVARSRAAGAPYARLEKTLLALCTTLGVRIAEEEQRENRDD